MPLPAGCLAASLAGMNVRAGVVTRDKPPFRAEHIGSLLRPGSLLEQRSRCARGEISPTDLTAAEDDAISDASPCRNASVFVLRRTVNFAAGRITAFSISSSAS